MGIWTSVRFVAKILTYCHLMHAKLKVVTLSHKKSHYSESSDFYLNKNYFFILQQLL
jgi:hypothetical protein